MHTPTMPGLFSRVPRSVDRLGRGVASARSTAAQAASGPGRALAHGLATLLLVAGGSLTLAPQAALASTSTGYNHDSQVLSVVHGFDWMSQVPDGTPLGRMSIPGTHDSMALHGGDAYQTQELCGTSAAPARVSWAWRGHSRRGAGQDQDMRRGLDQPRR